MTSLLFALAQSTIVITGPPPAGAPPSNPDYIFSAYDYPAEAVTNRWQGTVVTELIVGTDGRPTLCRITKSSGYKALDGKTCELLMTRTHFTPATDKQGRPIEDKVDLPPVTWRLAK